MKETARLDVGVDSRGVGAPIGACSVSGSVPFFKMYQGAAKDNSTGMSTPAHPTDTRPLAILGAPQVAPRPEFFYLISVY